MISYAVRQTIPQVCSLLEVSQEKLAGSIGLKGGRQAFYKMRQAKKGAETTASVPALLAFYCHMSYGDESLAKSIAGILNSRIDEPKYRFHWKGLDPFLENWWACVEP